MVINKKSLAWRIRIILTYGFIIFAGLISFIPLCNMLAISFSSARANGANEVFLLPVEFTIDAYLLLLKESQFWKAFFTSVTRVVLSLTINMLMIVLTAYAMTKSERDFRGRNFFMGLLLFAMMFGGGTVPMYLLVKELGLINKIWALVLPGALPIFNAIMVKNFFLGIPASLEESATIDGANPFQILFHIMIPCSKPVLATVALFSIVGNWNDYFSGLVYMTHEKKFPLMTYIRSANVNLQQMAEQGASIEQLEQAAKLSNEALTSAKLFIAIVPLLLIYPLLQKYLINGITVGAVKE